VSPRKLKTDPIILDMPSQKMAVTQAKGSPTRSSPRYFLHYMAQFIPEV